MRINVKLVSFFALLLLCFSAGGGLKDQTAAQSPGAAGSTKPSGDESPMLQPSDFFRDFPELKWGMSFQDAKRAIEKTGARPVRAFKDDETELVWTATFEGMSGRARIHFKEGGGADDIAVGVYAYEKQRDVFEAWLKKLTARHGAAKEGSDNSILVSKVWRLKNGFVIELRSLKDVNSPVVDIHWVKE